MRRLSWRQFIDLVRFLRDPEAGAGAKAVALLAVVYLLWPLDLLPGLPPFSWLDDATVLWLAYQVLSLQLERYRRSLAGRGNRRGGPGSRGGDAGTGGGGSSGTGGGGRSFARPGEWGAAAAGDEPGSGAQGSGHPGATGPVIDTRGRVR